MPELPSMEASICFCSDRQEAPPMDVPFMPEQKINKHLPIEEKSKGGSMTAHLTAATEAEIKKNIERQRAKEYKGSMAEPRTFVKHGTYTGAELKRRWRATMWDNLPSMMANVRHYKCF